MIRSKPLATILKPLATVFLTGAVMLAISGCHTTVVQPVERPAAQPDHRDDHHDDRYQPPPPPPDRRDDRR